MKETLGDYVEIILGGTPKTADEEYWGGDISFITPGDIGDTKHITSTARTITESGLHNSNTKLLDVGDVVISARGTVGKVMECDRPMAFNQSCYAIRTLDKNVCHPKYLFYLIKTCIKYLQQHASGSVFKAIIMSTLARVPVDLPSMNHQQSIASTLSAYDDLIENNRRRIQLLEQAARLLYKEWFVHLCFPGHEHVTITDGVPEGWERKTYSDLFRFLGGFSFKSKTYLSEGKFGIVTIKNVQDAQFITECLSRLDDVPEKMKAHCALDTGDILLSLTGNVGRACIVLGENYLLNQRVAKVVGNSDIPRAFTYWTFSNDTTQKELENLAHGVAQLNISPVKLSDREFLSPPTMVLESFAEIGEPILQQIISLNLGIMQLTQARDLLLPRLMSGEVAV